MKQRFTFALKATILEGEADVVEYRDGEYPVNKWFHESDEIYRTDCYQLFDSFEDAQRNAKEVVDEILESNDWLKLKIEVEYFNVNKVTAHEGKRFYESEQV